MRNNDDNIDKLELAIQECTELRKYRLKHEFIPGFYIRTVYIPVWDIVTSKIHKTRHPFYLSKGKVNVQVDDGEVVTIEAGYWGMTEIGTRRVVFTLEESEWTTIHAMPFITGIENECSDEEKEQIALRIENEIIEKRENKLLNKSKEGQCLL